VDEAAEDLRRLLSNLKRQIEVINAESSHLIDAIWPKANGKQSTVNKSLDGSMYPG
jgi:ABC-type transporter Mla subunit MlaD